MTPSLGMAKPPRISRRSIMRKITTSKLPTHKAASFLCADAQAFAATVSTIKSVVTEKITTGAMTAPLPTQELDPVAAATAATNATTAVAAPAAEYTPPSPSKTHLVPNPTLQTSPSKPVATMQTQFHHLVPKKKKKKTKEKKTKQKKKKTSRSPTTTLPHARLDQRTARTNTRPLARRPSSASNAKRT
eukprot:CAMPEP_0168286402 /NCGR_PEP_ID=MMETSP0142_2-20121227/1108_1 /TAXON_ID=44445 /ORGANISM="Pseudo-nitzschia australis, Strain 10249 10 AB" /LENGTH=188 /DNA_ID=CAMNT_0008231079 /DNA_START=793 /DNA_END=1356 /DNA_ORIENTATION=-